MYRNIFNISTDGMLIIEDGIFVDCNDSVVKMLQYKNKEELLNTHPSELSPKFQPDGLSSYEKVEDNTKYVLEHGSRTFEWVHLRANGEPFWVEVVLTDMSIDDKLIFLTVWREIGEKKRLEEKNNYQHMLLTSVLDSNDDLIFYKDYTNKNGKYIGCNKAFEYFVGKSKEEIIGHDDIELFGEKLGKFFREKDLDVIKMNTTISNEEWVKYPNGDNILLETKKVLLQDDKDNIIGILGISKNITKNKKRKEKIEELSNLLSNSINSVENLIFVKDNEFKYLECNKAFEKFIGVSREELIGRDDYDFFDKKLADFFRAKDTEIFKSEKKVENLEWTTFSDGREVYLYTITTPLRNSLGEIIGLVGNSVDLTKQKKLEDELRASKKQFELFMDNIPYAVVIKDEDTKVIYANKNVQKYLTQDIIGNTSTENLGNEIGLQIDALIKKATKDGKVEEIIHRKLNNKDCIARVLVFKIPQSNGKIYTGVIYVDITQGYQIQHEVSRLKSALERSPISIMMTDIDGNIEYVNLNYTKVSGYSLEELIGENPRIVKSGYTSDKKYKEMWKHISSGHTWTADIKNIAKDGSEFWEDSTIMPSFNEHGEVDGYIAFKLEITEKIHLKEELKNKEEMMMVQSRHAAMGEMISMIAHQWRQPLSIISMGANNILADVELHMVEEKSLVSGAEGIIEQTLELSKTIDDFKNFFKPEKLAVEILPEDIFNEAFGVIGKLLENSSIELVCEFNNGKKITTYSRELMQVLINILKNAKEALVEKREHKRKIFISIANNKNEVFIKICDNAGGIKEEIITKIFNPYFSTKDNANGTGLGLYMSKTIVEKHLNGVITAYNKDEGACFEIKLPYSIK